MTGSLDGKTVVVTGANSGIGKETARALAKMGARVVMVCRDHGKGAAALAEIRSVATGATPELMECDMASQASIRRFAAAYVDRFDRLDVLVNNAGSTFPRRELSQDGVEMTLAVNHLGYFLTTCLLLEKIKASAPARIVSVASAGHRFGALAFDNLQGERRYGELWQYGTSKLCNIAFTYELARRLAGSGVTANCVHPGAVSSNFGASARPWFRTVMKLGKPFMLSPESGAQTSIYLASSAEVDDVTGTYFARCKPARSSRASHDRAAQCHLWELSETLTGLAAAA
jgi:NAD(P)-dependent dehydrogenase (short-subunit alcohol dehydrogenase family)